MKLSDIILERLSSVVYHATSLDSIYKILTKNTFIASPLFTKDQESGISDKHYFYLSTARSRTSPFITNLLSSDKAIGILQLDGDKLSQNLKGKSINYFLNHKNNELEDRLYTNDQYIRNALDYIEQVTIYIPLGVRPTENMLAIQNLCKQHSIPIYFFDDKNAAISNNRNKSINPKDVIKDIDTPVDNTPKVTKNLEALLFFYENSDPHNIPTKFKNFVNDLTIDHYKNSWISDLTKELNKLSRDKQIVEYFTEILKKERVMSIRDLVNKISDKWKNLLKKSTTK